MEEYERKWGVMESTLRVIVGDDNKKRELKEFADALRVIAQNNRAKAEPLLLTLPPFYSSLVENLRRTTIPMATYQDKFACTSQQGRKVQKEHSGRK